MRTLGFAAIALALSLAPARAADNGCDKFAWPLTQERAWFAAPDKPAVNAGDTLAAIPNGAFVLHLQPDTAARFSMPPERRAKSEHWFGGMVQLPALDAPGTWQVTLSAEAWIDVVQNGGYAHAVANSGRHDCPGLRKSVRFEIGAGPLVLQLSGAAADQIVVAISRGN